MTRVSRIRLKQKQLSFFLNNFWSLVTLLEDKDQVKIFLKDLLTHTEMEMLAKRIQIAKMLLEGYNYKDIKAFVKVTDPTIAKISNILSIDGFGLKTAVAQLQKIEKEIDEQRIPGQYDQVKNKMGIYFLPEKLIEEGIKRKKQLDKQKSSKKNLSL